MKKKEEKLPIGWVKTTLGDITYLSRNRANPQDFPNLSYIGLQQIEAHTMKLIETISSSEVKSSSFHFFPGDVLYARMRSYLNKIYRADFEGLCSAEFVVFRESKYLYSKFLQYLLNSPAFVSFATELGIGDRPRIKYEQISEYSVNLPPLSEQYRIVDEIEKQFSSLDVGESALKRVQVNLLRYRSSVLKSISDGSIIPKNSDIIEQKETTNESSVQLIQKILNSKSENTLFPREYGDMKSQKVSNEFPKYWSVIKLDEIAEVVDPNPKHRNPEYIKEGFPFLSTAQFAYPDGFDISTAKQVSEEVVLEQENRCGFSDRSIAFSRKGTIGVTRFLPSDYRFALLDSLCVISPSEHLSAKFINLMLNTPYVQKQISKKSRGIALKQISVGDVRSLLVLIPPLSEQIYIVSEVERRFSVLDDFSTLISLNLNRASKLRRSILKLAFSGGLVEQNEKDEAAENLLEKIKREKQEITKPEKISRSPRQKNMPIKPVNTLEELLGRLDRLGGKAEPDRLLNEAGLSDNIETFFDLLRQGRNEKKLEVPVGETKPIRRTDNAH
jgi:type I restriction enzyme S subunit